jgi:hypothetical protein
LMNWTDDQPWTRKLFPLRRFDPDFPLAFWFAGLWFYLKGFLYLCTLYMIGLEPAPYALDVKVEIVYFAVAVIPSLLLGLALWNEKRSALKPAIVFLVVDTPFLLFHVIRLAETGMLESGLTNVLEYGGLALNLVAVCWLIGYAAVGEK